MHGTRVITSRSLWGWLNPVSTKCLQSQSPQRWPECLSTWNTESISEILSVIFFSLVPSTICFIVAWTWGRQVRDPLHCAYLSSTRSYRSSCCCVARRSAIRVGEYSPLYHSQSRGNTPVTAHSHHATTQTVPATRHTPPQRHARHGVPPPLVLDPPEMAQATRVAVTVNKNHNNFQTQTMSPLALESPSPYGVSPGPPSFAGAPADYSYSYELHEGDENRRETQPVASQPATQVRRGRGEYWFV